MILNNLRVFILFLSENLLIVLMRVCVIVLVFFKVVVLRVVLLFWFFCKGFLLFRVNRKVIDEMLLDFVYLWKIVLLLVFWSGLLSLSFLLCNILNVCLYYFLFLRVIVIGELFEEFWIEIKNGMVSMELSCVCYEFCFNEFFILLECECEWFVL